MDGNDCIMKVYFEDSLKFKIQERLKSIKSSVIIRKDFADLGSYRQISRGLKGLVDEGKIVRIASGVYAKAYKSTYTNKLLIENGFDSVSREALNRLGITWEPGTDEQTYNRGESTQVPTQNIICLKSRFRRKIKYINRELIFERNINAK